MKKTWLMYPMIPSACRASSACSSNTVEGFELKDGALPGSLLQWFISDSGKHFMCKRSLKFVFIGSFSGSMTSHSEAGLYLLNDWISVLKERLKTFFLFSGRFNSSLVVYRRLRLRDLAQLSLTWLCLEIKHTLNLNTHKKNLLWLVCLICSVLSRGGTSVFNAGTHMKTVEPVLNVICT